MTVARDVGGEHTNLAIGDLARRPGILPTNATGRLALLEKAGLITRGCSRIDILDLPRLTQLAIYGEDGFVLTDPSNAEPAGAK